MFKKSFIAILLCTFLTTSLGPMPSARASLPLPAPGTMVNLSPAFEPVLIKGLKVHPDNPFAFDFIVDTGSDPDLRGHVGQAAASAADPNVSPFFKQEADKLIKYFLASMTIPEKDLWVNLSPYERDRMISPI